MNAFAIAGLGTLVAGLAVLGTGDELKVRPPAKEHHWLQQLTGEWDTEVEAVVEPGQLPKQSKGTESIRPVGGYWVLSEIQGTCPIKNTPFTSFLTLGYDQDQAEFVGTWVDSMSSYLWKYEGTLDPARNALTLETEGPCPMAPEKHSRFREVIELKDKDHKVLTMSIQGADGGWVTMVTCNSRRRQ